VLCKLTVSDTNVDLWLACPPRASVDALVRRLGGLVTSSGDALLREVALVLLHAACRADPAACHVLGVEAGGVDRLTGFLEAADTEMQRVGTGLLFFGFIDNRFELHDIFKCRIFYINIEVWFNSYLVIYMLTYIGTYLHSYSINYLHMLTYLHTYILNNLHLRT